MFYIFIKACKKYRFIFKLGINGGVTSLRIVSKETFDEFHFANDCNNYFILFFEAIIKMRQHKNRNKNNKKEKRWHKWVKFI